MGGAFSTARAGALQRALRPMNGSRGDVRIGVCAAIRAAFVAQIRLGVMSRTGWRCARGVGEMLFVHRGRVSVDMAGGADLSTGSGHEVNLHMVVGDFTSVPCGALYIVRNATRIESIVYIFSSSLTLGSMASEI